MTTSATVWPVRWPRPVLAATWACHALVGLLYAALIASLFHPWLRPYYQPMRGGPELAIRAGDLTPLFSVWTQVAANSLYQRGQFPLWSDHIYAGEPFFAKPQIGVISVTTILAGLVPAHLAATWTFLIHLWLGGICMYGWCLFVVRGTERRDAGPSVSELPYPAICAAAACGGVAFMLSSLMIEHTMIGHGPIVLVACFTPLVLWQAHAAFSSDQPICPAAFAGVTVAVQLLAGGETIFLYNAAAGFILALAWLLLGSTSPVDSADAAGWPGRMRRVILVALVIGLVGFGLSAVKVLPGLELMPVTNRAGGLSRQDAAGFVHEFSEPVLFRLAAGGAGELADLRRLLPATVLLAMLGFGTSMMQPTRRWITAAAFALTLAGIAIAHSETVFGLLWQYMPMFRFQRIPQRALVLSYVGLALLVSIGVRRLASAVPKHGGWIGSILVLLVTAETWHSHPKLPPVADIRKEISDNAIWNYVARQPGQFRIHAAENTDRNWGFEHVTVPLGLSNLVGWDHLWLLEYLGAEGVIGREIRPYLTASYEAQHPARFWGMMNVGFVTAMRPIAVPGLELVGQFAVSPLSQPKKSAGPYLYKNRRMMPRAWLAPYAILVLGDRAERKEAVYRILDHNRFDPYSVTVVEADRLAEHAHALDRYPAIVMPVTERARYESAAKVDEQANSQKTAAADQQHRHDVLEPLAIYYQAHARPDGVEFRWLNPDELASVLERLEKPKEAGGPSDPFGHFSISSSGRGRIDFEPAAGYLVLAEKIAHFPGWSAESDHGRRELLRANYVATAVPLDGSERSIEFTYRPRTLLLGISISAITFTALIVWPIVQWKNRRTFSGG